MIGAWAATGFGTSTAMLHRRRWAMAVTVVSLRAWAATQLRALLALLGTVSKVLLGPESTAMAAMFPPTVTRHLPLVTTLGEVLARASLRLVGSVTRAAIGVLALAGSGLRAATTFAVRIHWRVLFSVTGARMISAISLAGCLWLAASTWGAVTVGIWAASGFTALGATALWRRATTRRAFAIGLRLRAGFAAAAFRCLGALSRLLAAGFGLGSLRRWGGRR